MLSVRDLELGHGEQTIIRGLNLDFLPGEVTGLVGPNGSGKSTFLRALFGDHPARTGNLRLDDRAYRPADRHQWQGRIGYMPQDNGASGGLTALEAVLLGSLDRLSLFIREDTLHRAAASLERLGVLDLAHRRIETLSGGQRQVIFFAQALMRAPRVLLLDEPVSALDIRHQMLLLKQVKEATAARELVTIVVLHDLNLAGSFADRLVMIHDGRTQVDGVPRLVLSTQLLEEVYGVRTKLHYDPDGRPWVHVHDASDTKDTGGSSHGSQSR